MTEQCCNDIVTDGLSWLNNMVDNVVHADRLNLVHAGQLNAVYAGQLNVVHAG